MGASIWVRPVCCDWVSQLLQVFLPLPDGNCVIQSRADGLSRLTEFAFIGYVISRTFHNLSEPWSPHWQREYVPNRFLGELNEIPIRDVLAPWLAQRRCSENVGLSA